MGSRSGKIVIKDMDSNPIACIDWGEWRFCDWLPSILLRGPGADVIVMSIYAFKPFFDGQEPTTEKQDGKPLYAWAKVQQTPHGSVHDGDAAFRMFRSVVLEMQMVATKYTSESYLSWTDYSFVRFQRTLAVVKGKDPSRGGCCISKRKPSKDEITATVAPNIDPILMLGLMICWPKYLYRRNCGAFFNLFPRWLFFATVVVCAICFGDTESNHGDGIFVLSMLTLFMSVDYWHECVIFLCSKSPDEEMVDTESTALLAKDV